MIDLAACAQIIENAHKKTESICFQDQYNAYLILEDITSTYYYEFRAMIIYSIFENKCNAYIFEMGDPLRICNDPMEIIKKGIPLPLRLANEAFPDYGFDEENYGF